MKDFEFAKQEVQRVQEARQVFIQIFFFSKSLNITYMYMCVQVAMCFKHGKTENEISEMKEY